jgi:2-isopropylmalate synthase
VQGSGDGALAAFVAAIGEPIRIMDYTEHAIGTGTDTRAACYVETRVGDSPTGFGVGIDGDIVTASFRAVLSAVNRRAAARSMIAETAEDEAIA